MGIFIQHSYGKSDKVNTLIENELSTGIILSPKGESTPDKMVEVTNIYSAKGNFTVLFDPHFHLGLIENCTDSKIKEYEYYRSNLQQRDFSSPKKIISYVGTVLDFQKNYLNISGFVSPTCIIESFENSLASILMAQSSIEYSEDNSLTKDLYISFVVSENAFRGSKDAMDDFITNITGIDKLTKIYLVIDRSTDAYSQQMDANILQNILYFIYSLSMRNGIEIICGYTDLIGLLYMSVGAKSIATGWSQKSRYFSRNNYKEMNGGSPPKARYTSIPLLNSIFNSPELQTIENCGLIEDVRSHTSYDDILKDNVLKDAWNKNISFYHHMECLNILASEFDQLNDIEDKIDLMKNKINNADVLYKKLISEGVQFSQYNNNTHITQWQSAIIRMEGMISL